MAVSAVTGAWSDVGPVRANNEDSGYAGTHLAVVADGVGGHAAGEVASAAVVEALRALDRPITGASGVQVMTAAVADVQRTLTAMVGADAGLAGMGTTLTALLVTDDQLVLAHIGDSRAYRYRRAATGGVLEQVSRDDTFVQQLVDDASISAEQARTHPWRNVITASLGDAGGSTEIAVSVHEAVIGQRWLLCSDGVSDVLRPVTMAGVLEREPASWVCARDVVDLAVRAGATDNVTCVVVDIVRHGCLIAMEPRVVGAVGPVVPVLRPTFLPA